MAEQNETNPNNYILIPKNIGWSLAVMVGGTLIFALTRLTVVENKVSELEIRGNKQEQSIESIKGQLNDIRLEIVTRLSEIRVLVEQQGQKDNSKVKR